MNHLEDLSIDDVIESAEDLARVFTTCPKITRLSVDLMLDPIFYESDELRPPFQRLKFLKLGECTLSSFATILL
jgi:hypothetical protein